MKTRFCERQFLKSFSISNDVTESFRIPQSFFFLMNITMACFYLGEIIYVYFLCTLNFRLYLKHPSWILTWRSNFLFLHYLGLCNIRFVRIAVIGILLCCCNKTVKFRFVFTSHWSHIKTRVNGEKLHEHSCFSQNIWYFQWKRTTKSSLQDKKTRLAMYLRWNKRKSVFIQ